MTDARAAFVRAIFQCFERSQRYALITPSPCQLTGHVTSTNSAQDLIEITPHGLYCPAGDFYIDPHAPVARALITHGHSDHARSGHGAVLATNETLAIMATRYGADFCGQSQSAALGAPIQMGGVQATFYPAGHVLGSAQILIEKNGFRLVVSGDYKRCFDPTCAPFELVRCHAFVTEATFGLPVFTHPPDAIEIGKLLASVAANPERAHLVGVYALGKAQRLMALLRRAGYAAPLYIHGALAKLTGLYQKAGVDLGAIEPVEDAVKIGGALVLCPPSAIQDRWSCRFSDPVTGVASGWMRVRARARQRGVELPLIISDHADWPELTQTVLETGCEELWITHGAEDALAYWAQARGLNARPLRLLGYDGESEL
jgi:putative mRNA 3-end processing factor